MLGRCRDGGCYLIAANFIDTITVSRFVRVGLGLPLVPGRIIPTLAICVSYLHQFVRLGRWRRARNVRQIRQHSRRLQVSRLLALAHRPETGPLSHATFKVNLSSSTKRSYFIYRAHYFWNGFRQRVGLLTTCFNESSWLQFSRKFHVPGLVAGNRACG